MDKYYLNKHLWLCTWPKELVDLCLLYPDIFTPRILFSIFASRQKYYSKNEFEYLHAEIKKLIDKGAKHKPRKAVNYQKSRSGSSLLLKRIRKENLKKINKERAIEKKTKEYLKLDLKKSFITKNNLKKRADSMSSYNTLNQEN